MRLLVNERALFNEVSVFIGQSEQKSNWAGKVNRKWVFFSCITYTRWVLSYPSRFPLYFLCLFFLISNSSIRSNPAIRSHSYFSFFSASGEYSIEQTLHLLVSNIWKHLTLHNNRNYSHWSAYISHVWKFCSFSSTVNVGIALTSNQTTRLSDAIIRFDVLLLYLS